MLIAVLRRPWQSSASYGAKVIRPGIDPYHAARHWELLPACPSTGPLTLLKITGAVRIPPLIYLSLAELFTRWSIACRLLLKLVKCVMGLSPINAAPIESPALAAGVIGACQTLFCPCFLAISWTSYVPPLPSGNQISPTINSLSFFVSYRSKVRLSTLAMVILTLGRLMCLNLMREKWSLQRGLLIMGVYWCILKINSMGGECSAICNHHLGKEQFQISHIACVQQTGPAVQHLPGKPSGEVNHRQLMEVILEQVTKESLLSLNEPITDKVVNMDPVIQNQPIEISKDGVNYQGKWNGNSREGYGVQIWPDGTMYEGNWQNNLANGFGKFTHTNGDFYEGHWINGNASGKGMSILKDGTRYEGDWVDDLKDGTGQQHLPDGSVYIGQYRLGFRQGQGYLKQSDKEFYRGQWKNNKISGNGVHSWADGGRYEGEFVDGEMNGLGVHIWLDGTKYDGQYKNGKKHGHGIFTWEDGKKYTGQWYNGNRHGEGKYTLADGTVQKGIWQNDVRTKWVDPDEADQRPRSDSKKTASRLLNPPCGSSSFKR